MVLVKLVSEWVTQSHFLRFVIYIGIWSRFAGRSYGAIKWTVLPARVLRTWSWAGMR